MDETLWELSESYSFDSVLYLHDLNGSRAHVQGLAEAGLLSAAESATLLAALDQIQDEFESGEFVRFPTDEDVHTRPNSRETSAPNSTLPEVETTRSPRRCDSSRATL